ncbi:glutamate ABC transporter substrate-binding protein [Arthrobacter russicus]|jgi:glutamate transport system substrate-binding protein|uniref:Glutamate transport system substrate-binding protein n=1 Tax=Arthrobacter russicus TaxID=172040 RepID=A0ABU1J8J7_9MICC|nr:glutamate ABC transporter substrate-binding protein [Arthrobacter russicus]MDN5668326.1 glutamate ABC transporter substrate-binding protein [Renibacterium salmoninarum]MDR6268752.1 glutamate transport system substrate-binding protein [Arthrobacter russicus]
MRFSKKASIFGATVVAAALTLSACGGGAAAPGDATSDAPYKVAENVSVSGSPTFDKIKSAGKITIGVKEDQPGLGFKDPATGEYSGFDIDIARWMAASLGLGTDKITFQAVASSNREQALANGQVDLYVGTYSITDKRKALVDFAGPYFVTGQGLLVKKDNTSINSEKDLAGKTVCSATGSTPIQNIKANFPDTKTQEFDLYSKCVEALKTGSVDAVTTDQAILLGYAAQDPDNLKVVGQPFTTEKYGIGIKKGDTALRTFLNETLTNGKDVWTKIYDGSLGKSGTKVEQPAVENY